jgi:CrcB protein
MKTLFLVFFGGGIGSVLRYLTSIITFKYYNGLFPIATLVVNLIGCFLIGLMIGIFEKMNVSPDMKFLFVTGFCGGFTTFSAFSIETNHLIQNQQFIMAISYILTSVIVGIMAVWTGLLIAK